MELKCLNEAHGWTLGWAAAAVTTAANFWIFSFKLKINVQEKKVATIFSSNQHSQLSVVFCQPDYSPATMCRVQYIWIKIENLCMRRGQRYYLDSALYPSMSIFSKILIAIRYPRSTFNEEKHFVEVQQDESDLSTIKERIRKKVKEISTNKVESLLKIIPKMFHNRMKNIFPFKSLCIWPSALR